MTTTPTTSTTDKENAMTAPTRPASPGLAYAAFALLLAGAGAAGWYRSAWPLLAGLLAFLALAFVATRPKAHP